MWKIVKALNYQIKRDNVMIYGFLGAFLLQLLGLIDLSDGNFGDITGSIYLLSELDLLPMVLLLFEMLYTTRICGWDHNDKTINYELLAGHSRGSVYFARVFLSVVWSVGGCLVVALAPVFLMTLLNGWGVSVSAGDMAIRGLLVLFPLVRGICLWALLCFLLGSGHVALLVGYLLVVGEVMAAMLLNELDVVKLDAQLTASSLMQICTLSNSKMEYIDGEDVTVMLAVVEPSQALATVCVSLAVIGLYLLAGHLFFRKKDMA